MIKKDLLLDRKNYEVQKENFERMFDPIEEKLIGETIMEWFQDMHSYSPQQKENENVCDEM